MRIINISKDYIYKSALRIKQIIISFNPDNIKISKKLISSYSITLFFMIVIGATCILSVEKAKNVSTFQAKIEHILLNLRTADQHMFAYYADRHDYRPKIILKTTKTSAEDLKSVLNEVPSSLKPTYDTAYIEIASMQEIGDNYFKSTKSCDSCINVSKNLIDSLEVEISKESSISSRDLSKIYKNIKNVSLSYNTHNHQLGLLKQYGAILNGIKANGKILNKYKNRTSPSLIKINNHLYENSNLFKKLNQENRLFAYNLRKISYYTAIRVRKALNKTSVIFKDELYRNIVFVVATIIFAIVLLVVIAFFILRSIARGLESVNDAAKKIADGDLTIKFSNKDLSRKDEIGGVNKSFSAMIESLSRIIKNIEFSSVSLDDSAKELNSGAQNMSDDANTQAVSIEEISATVEDITLEIDLNSQNSNKTSSLSQISVKHIEKIEKQNTEQITKSIEILNKSKYVSSIAMETNILAINAAIEASKAGMAGKSFSVIANEVKKLAENSKNAAVEITGITKIGAKLSKDGGEMLKEILPNIKDVNTLIQEIAKVGNAQRTKSENIKDALISLRNISQNNVAQSEELTSQSEEVKEQAIMLKKQISFFKIDK